MTSGEQNPTRGFHQTCVTHPGVIVSACSDWSVRIGSPKSALFVVKVRVVRKPNPKKYAASGNEFKQLESKPDQEDAAATADAESPRRAETTGVELVPDGRRAVPPQRAPAAHAAAAAALDCALLVAQPVDLNPPAPATAQKRDAESLQQQRWTQ